MTAQEQEYWDKNNNEKAALEYGVANGTINAEDALTETADLKAKKPTVAEKTTGGK
jgi:hypothetical protein